MCLLPYWVNPYIGLMKKRIGLHSLADMAVSNRQIRNLFFDQLDAVLDWPGIEAEISKHYKAGLTKGGKPAYSGLLLFKMSLLGIWYGLSDRDVESRVNDSLSFSMFCGLSLADKVPDHSCLSRFRKQMMDAGGWDSLLAAVAKQFEDRGMVVRNGGIIDASITDSPRKPRGRKEYELVEDRDEEAAGSVPKTRLEKVVQAGVDTEADWTKKARKLHYGYKKHHFTTPEGCILAVETTPASQHDKVAFKPLVERSGLEKGSRVYCDKGYASQERRDWLKEQELKDGIMHKAARGRTLTHWQTRFNKLVSKVRYMVEHGFGGQKRWFKAGKARYVGLVRTHVQHVLEAIAYNLKMLPSLETKRLKR
jgi:transposase, IS5 family